MITENDVYWVTRGDILCDVTHTVAIITFLCAVVMATIGGLYNVGVFNIEERVHPGAYSTATRATASIRWPYWVAVGFLVLAFLSCTFRVLTPTTKEGAAIKIIPLVANNQEVKGVGSELASLAKEWMIEMRPKKAEKHE